MIDETLLNSIRIFAPMLPNPLGDVALEFSNEITRLREALRYQDDRDGHIGTHSRECYKFGQRHYECALREIQRLNAKYGVIQ
jgi:hypothetical protein